MTTLQQQLDAADLAGYAAAEKLNMPSIPGSYALEAGEEARRWLMEKYKKEFDVFCDGFERHNKERYREATNAVDPTEQYGQIEIIKNGGYGYTVLCYWCDRPQQSRIIGREIPTKLAALRLAREHNRGKHLGSLSVIDRFGRTFSK